MDLQQGTRMMYGHTHTGYFLSLNFEPLAGQVCLADDTSMALIKAVAFTVLMGGLTCKLPCREKDMVKGQPDTILDECDIVGQA